MSAVRTQYALTNRAVSMLHQLIARCKSVMDAVRALCERRVGVVHVDDVRTLCARWNRHIWYILAYFAPSPHRADMFSERCTNAMESPIGVTCASSCCIALFI